MTTETITDAFEEAAAEKLLAEAQTEMDGQGFEKPVKTRRQLAEEFLEHFQADVEKAETAVYNARRKHREAVEIRDDAEENLRRAIREENETVDSEAEEEYEGPRLLEAAEDAEYEEENDPGETHVVVAVYPGDEPCATEVGRFTRYGELVADYGTAAGVDIELGDWMVLGEDDGKERDLGAGIDSADWGKRLLVVEKVQAS